MNETGTGSTHATPPLKILKASAGSGKTFALTTHFLRLLLDRPTSYREILALTFTNKATAEMKSRILEALEALAAGKQDTKSGAYFQALHPSFPDWTPEQIRDRADQAYRRILHDYSRFSVQTIDRFSQQVIRGFTYELGLDSGFRIELNTDKVGRDLMDRLYAQLHDNQDLFDWMVVRMLRQIEEDKSWNINKALFELSRIIFSDDFRKLEEVYSRKGNEDLFERVADRSLVGIREFEERVLHSTRLIAGIIEKSGVTADDLYYKGRNFLTKFKEYKEHPGDLEALQKGVEKLSDRPDEYQSAKSRTAQVEALFTRLNPEMTHLQQVLNEELPRYNLLKAVDENIHYLRLLRDMADLLSEWRSDNGAQLISDAQTLLAKIGRTEQGDPTFIWEKIGNRYRYFLFDEFQDTSHAQWDNLMPLLINALGSGGQSNPAHLIVGDVKQSIYRWRDGDFRILLEGVEKGVARAFHLPDTRRLISKDSLRYNFRSGRNIVEFNNFLYTRLPVVLQHEINGQAGNAMGDDYALYWEQAGLHDTILRAYEDAVQEIPPSGQGGPEPDPGAIHIEYIGVGEDETGRISMSAFREQACAKAFDQIAEWIAQKRFGPGEIGVLVRTKKEATLLIDFFRAQQAREGYAFQVISGDALLLSGHAAVRAIIAALRFLAYEGREFNSFLAEMVFEYGAAKGRTPDVETWLAVGEGRLQGLAAFLPGRLLEAWGELKQLPLASLVERLIRDFDFNEDASAMPYLLALMDSVAAFVKNNGSGLLGFLEFWDEEGASTPLSAGTHQDAVEILTIHKSKGLEYEAVMIPFCTWNLAGKPDGQVWFDVTGERVVSDFERIPLKFGRQVRESVLFGQYYTEQLYNYMDALNGLYVATTRARTFLWMLAPDPVAKKQDSGKQASDKEGGSPRDGVNVTDVGKLIYKVLGEHAQVTTSGSLYLGTDKYVSGATDPEVKQGDDVVDHEGSDLIIRGYPGSDLLINLLSTKYDMDPEKREKQRLSAMFSSALHEMMASLQASEDIAGAVSHLVAEGRLSQTEGERAVQLLDQAWSHPVLGPLLTADYRQGNEQAIIDKNGKTWRPDKVLFADQETVVIDFKLSSTLEDPSHIAQLQGYMDFLQQMGLPDVKGYLYYFLQHEMVAVNGK